MKTMLTAVFLFVLVFKSGVALAEIGVSDKEVVVGAHTTESGPLAWAAPWALGAAAYFDEVNEKGGVFGRKIKFIRKDTQSLPPKTVEAMRDLVEKEKIFATVACSGTSHMAVYKYLNEKGVPDFYMTDPSSAYAAPSLKRSFPLTYSVGTETKAYVDHIVSKKAGKKVCVLKTNDAYGDEYLKGVKEGIEEHNAKAAGGDKLELGPVAGAEKTATQADSEILSFKSAKCDVVMLSTPPPLAPNAINYAFSQGYKPLWFVNNFCTNKKFIDLLNEGAQDGVVSMTYTVRDDPMIINKKGWDDYLAVMKKHNVPVSGLSAGGYTAAEMFTETLKKAGKNPTRESLVEAATSYKEHWASLGVIPFTNSTAQRNLAKIGRMIVTKNKRWTFLD